MRSLIVLAMAAAFAAPGPIMSSPAAAMDRSDAVQFCNSGASCGDIIIAAAPTPMSALCKDQCQKHCMGNDTPTERAECLKREKCESQPACPTGTTNGTGTRFDPGSPTLEPTIRVPRVEPGRLMHR